MSRNPTGNESRGDNRRYRDRIRIESVVDRVELNHFNSIRISNDLTRPSEAAFDVGDDGTWDEIEVFTGLGKEWRVFVNDRLHLQGRIEMNDIPIDPATGASVRFVVRTKLADAMYASASPSIRVESTSIEDFIFAIFAPLGYTPSDFVLRADLSRDLLTGVSSDGRDSPIALDELKAEQAKVHPPETIYAAADRHLRRHGLMIWDAPDGKLVIGSPNDEQNPLFNLRMFKGSRGRENNILSATRKKDWSGVPSILGVFGTGGKKEWKKAKVRAVVERLELIEAGLYRPVLIVNEGVKTDALAERHANREMTNRSKNIDAWDVTVDGMSYWTGSERIPYGIDTVCNVHSDLAGGPTGAYLLHRVEKERTADGADSSQLTLLKRGVWVL